MNENNFQNNIKHIMYRYLQKYLKIFQNNYKSPNLYKYEKINIFIQELKEKTNFELLFQYIKLTINVLLKTVKIKIFQQKEKQEKINTLIEINKLFIAYIALLKFFNIFLIYIKKKYLLILI